MNFSSRLIDADSGEVIVARLALADTYWKRLKGLQFRRELSPDEGLLVTPCRSIHTHWMRFSIDVAMLDAEGTVLEVFSAIKPWRIPSGVKGTRAVLETAAGDLASRLTNGTRTQVVSDPAN